MQRRTLLGQTRLAAVAGLGLALGGTALTAAQTAGPSAGTPPAGTLRPPEGFQSISQREARSAALFRAWAETGAICPR